MLAANRACAGEGQCFTTHQCAEGEYIGVDRRRTVIGTCPRQVDCIRVDGGCRTRRGIRQGVIARIRAAKGNTRDIDCNTRVRILIGKGTRSIIYRQIIAS